MVAPPGTAKFCGGTKIFRGGQLFFASVVDLDSLL